MFKLQRKLFEAVSVKLNDFGYWALTPANASLGAINKHHRDFIMLPFPGREAKPLNPLYNRMPGKQQDSASRINAAVPTFAHTDAEDWPSAAARASIPMLDRLLYRFRWASARF